MPSSPTDERRADVEAFLDEQLGDLDLPEALDARLRDRIRSLALGRASVRPRADRPMPATEPPRP